MRDRLLEEPGWIQEKGYLDGRELTPALADANISAFIWFVADFNITGVEAVG